MSPPARAGRAFPGDPVLTCCWSTKGGSGTTVVAAALALSSPSLAVDLAGDLPAVLGLPEPAGPGVLDWLSAPDDVGPDALARIELAATPQLGLLPTGHGQPRPVRWAPLARALSESERHVVVDAGRWPVAPELLGAADRSLLVVRPCYLALRRAAAVPVRPTGVVLVVEEGRALGRRDVEQVLGVPVVAEVPVVPAVARAVDAGLLAGRVPMALAASLRSAA